MISSSISRALGPIRPNRMSSSSAATIPCISVRPCVRCIHLSAMNVRTRGSGLVRSTTILVIIQLTRICGLRRFEHLPIASTNAPQLLAPQERKKKMRVPELSYDQLSPEQKDIFDEITAGPRGRVNGPFLVWLHRHELLRRGQALGLYCRFNSGLEPRLSELTILVVSSY